jgi:hypothetical protein
MNESTDAVIRLSVAELQQALGIWLDSDAEQAIRFLKEKIVNRTFKRTVRCNSEPRKKIAPCQLVRCNSMCCRAGSVCHGG